MAKKITKSQSFNLTCQNLISSAIGIFLFIMFLLFPLYYDDFYFNILITKWGFYTKCAVSILAVCIFLALVFMFVDWTEMKGQNTKQLFSRLLPVNWRQTFSLADAAVLVFLIICGISTLMSDYRMEALTGTQGRRTGLGLTCLYVLVYFLVSRFWKAKNWLLEVFLVSGMLVCILGIGDYFHLDWLGFHARIAEEHMDTYVSTIGNINTYTAYVALVMGFASAMYAGADKTWKTVWYYICMVIAFFAIIMGCSDNAYLALGALFGFLPLLTFGSGKGIYRYFVMVATFFTVVLCIDLLNERFASIVIGLDSLFGVIASQKALLPGVCVLWAAAGGLFMWERKNRDPELIVKKIPLYLWLILLGGAALTFIYVMFDVNVAGHVQRYGALAGYLEFNDNWGTNRGYVWRAAWRSFNELPLAKKLVGYGPDTFRLFAVDSFFDEMVAVTGQRFDSAHNEYLQYLVTVGWLGLISYLIFLVSAGYRMIKSIIKNPYAAGIFIAVLCYLIQAIVNINLPIVTPTVWLLLSCGGAIARSDQKTT